MYTQSMSAHPGSQHGRATSGANNTATAPLLARDRLIQSALDSLIEVGFSQTTGVEVCRRANLTRGALNHHFPEFGQLLAAALGTAYNQILELEPADSGFGSIERWTLHCVAGVRQPAFKAIVELWLASTNDPNLRGTLTDAIALGAPMFNPTSALGTHDIDDQATSVSQTIKEACLGLGLGRVVGGVALDHEESVVAVLLELARSTDEKLANGNPKMER